MRLLRPSPSAAAGGDEDCCCCSRRQGREDAVSGSSRRKAIVSPVSSTATTDGPQHCESFWSRRRQSTIRQIPRLSAPAKLLAILFLALLAITPAAAVHIPFSNCLDDAYRLSDPPKLQWVPLYADAKFDTKGRSHSIEVVIYGNVTGSWGGKSLPGPNDPAWKDDKNSDGKIIRNPEPDAANPKATTLYRQVDVLTFTPWSSRDDFCEAGLANGTCPLGPVFDANLNLPDGLPSFNMSHDMFSSYAFSTFSPSFLLIWGDEAKTNIGCVSTIITPDLGSLAPLLRFLPLLILVLTGGAVIFASIYSPWGSTDVFHWTSNYGRDADQLRLVTPGFGDCLQYIQFVVLTGALSLDYPGFYQPITSQASWSALMFNQSFVTKSDPWDSVQDGIYVFNGTYGLEELGHLAGMAKPEDIWAGMMVWLLVVIAAVSILMQVGFAVSWAMRTLHRVQEEDLRSKALPFSLGNVIRIVFNFFLLPIVALSMFQLVIATDSPAYTVALAVVTIVLLMGFSAWALYFIIKTQPRATLFDNLETVLRYGPLYNTYSDHAAAYALIPVVLTFIRGIAIGAVQDSGIAQVILLAICEIIQVLTIHAFRPFNRTTSMNAYHTALSIMRFVVVMLMVAFAPSLGVGEGPKGWIGYVILVLHVIVLILGFFFNALQTVVEVIALMLGAGGDDERGLTRGGLSKIFGMRQLAKRGPTRNGPSRASQLSTSAMLDADASKTGYSMPSGRIRSESGGSLGGMLGPPRHRSSSALDSIDVLAAQGQHRHADSASSYMAGTPGGDTSTFSFLTSPTAARGQPQVGLPLEASDPYYRPPRRRAGTGNFSDSPRPESRQASAGVDAKRLSGGLAPPERPGEAAEQGAEISRGATPAPPGGNPTGFLPPNRPDYATREVDFYYGVRGPALNSDGPGRKLGTGPADPTGPVATATGWFRNMLGGKTKEKGKGFEVVRSARMPPDMMARNGAFGDETPPEGIPVAMGVLRNGPIDSDDDEPGPKRSPKKKPGDLLTDAGEPRGPDDDEPDSPVTERLPRGSQPPEPKASGSGGDQLTAEDGPDIPRKSSKRSSALLDSSRSVTPTPSHTKSADHSQEGSSGAPHISRLPFERANSQKALSSRSSTDFSISAPAARREERPASFGVVSQHSINRIDPERGVGDLFSETAEVVDETGNSEKKA